MQAGHAEFSVTVPHTSGFDLASSSRSKLGTNF